MGYKTVEKRFRGIAHRPRPVPVGARGPMAVHAGTVVSSNFIEVDLEKGPYDARLGDRIATVGYTDLDDAYRDMGESIVKRILEEEEDVTVTIPVTFTEWE